MDERAVRRLAGMYPEHILLPYGEMAALDGLAALCVFTGYFGGTSAYIPSLRSIFKNCIGRDIIGRYHNGAGIRELAREYGYSEKAVRNLIKAGEA
jgi:Mor family transcriptional regulator